VVKAEKNAINHHYSEVVGSCKRRLTQEEQASLQVRCSDETRHTQNGMSDYSQGRRI